MGVMSGGLANAMQDVFVQLLYLHFSGEIDSMNQIRYNWKAVVKNNSKRFYCKKN
jgi:hypothetical protein